MLPGKISSMKIALSVLMLVTSTTAFAQSNNRIKRDQPSSNYVDPNCPVTYVDKRCIPPSRLPKAASKDECSCELNRVNVGKRTLWVRNCYVQLPDRTIYYCKNPIHTPPKK